MSFRGKKYIQNDKFLIVTTVADFVEMHNYKKRKKTKITDKRRYTERRIYIVLCKGS